MSDSTEETTCPSITVKAKFFWVTWVFLKDFDVKKIILGIERAIIWENSSPAQCIILIEHQKRAGRGYQNRLGCKNRHNNCQSFVLSYFPQ